MNPRSVLHSAFAVLLISSVLCSAAFQYGHADVPIAATAADTQPLKVGDPAPRFVVETVEGAEYVFDPRTMARPALILTFRGGWCPYCNTYLSDMRHVIPEIDAMGIDVLFLSGDRAELLYDSLSHEAQADIAGLDYTILSDADAQAAMAFGIAFKAAQRTIDYVQDKGDGYVRSSMEKHGVLPVPSVFAIDRDGTIQFAHVNPDYKVRLPADELLAVASKMATD